ncbi:MAG: M48 family peptidase [Anaerolinea sp.]|nr:M48 family peptidase [Anaerolinea sp.]
MVIFDNIESPKMITVSYSNLQIPITVWFEARNRLRITVQPDKSIVAKAPLDYSLEEVQAKLEKRAPWMIRQLEYFDQYHPIMPDRQYISGETYYYLGRQYRLKVTAGSENHVKLIGKFFMLTTTQPENQDEKQQILKNWYTRHARVFIQNRVRLFVDRVFELSAQKPEIKYRRMNKRWGSCTPSGVITFNTELIKAPTHCIDYVVLHELCHLVHEGHSAKFYHLLDVLMPDWKKRKERLEKVILA